MHKMVNQYSYQPSQSNTNDQVMYTSNRSRSESGSSDSSRGSGNSGQSGKTRRRSHRPRGCRGGSNRRKQKNAEGGNKPFFKKTYNTDFKNRVHGKFSNSAMNQINRTGSSEAEIMVNNNKQQCIPDTCVRDSYDNNPGKDYNLILPEYNNYPPSELHHGGSMHGRNAQPYYRNPASKYISEPENDYPLLQSTFSESSSETFFEQRDAYGSHHQHNDGILPPLPSEELFDPPKQIPSGPNPYALKSSNTVYHNNNNNTNNNNSFYVTHTYAAPAPPMVQPVTRPKPRLVDTAVPTTPCLPGILQQVHNTIDTEYRSHRLEKQRQNVVGGSLFVTSPRSFLMGCKRSFHE